MEKYDVIIVGAGNGGLSAAAFASKLGLRTLLFESHNIPGGAVTSFRRGRFEFEPSVHEICEVGSEENPGNTRRLFAEAGVDAKLVHENTCYRIISTDSKMPFDVKLPCGIDEFCAVLEKEVPGCGEKVRKFLDYTKISMDVAERLAVKKVKFGDTKAAMNLLRMASYPSDKIMDMFEIPKKIQNIITPYWSYQGEPTSTMNGFLMGMMDYCYIVDGAGLPSCFSHELSLSFDKIIRKNGGKIFYNSPVSKILVKRKRAYGVVSQGKEYYADNIICNCFPNDVFVHLIEKKYVPKAEIKRINARKIALSFVNIHLGLNKTAQELGIEDYTTFIVQKADSTEQFNCCQELGGEGWIIANNLNVVIPECSPKGTCHMSITSAVYGDNWGKIEPKDYRKTKFRIAEKMIEYYEKSTGIRIKPYIEEIEVATPVTYSRYLGTPNGTAYGYQCSDWDGIVVRTMQKYKERSIKHLYFVGAHTEGSVGYNQTYKSGKIAIEEIMNGKF